MSNDLKDLEKKIHEAKHGKELSEEEQRRIRDQQNHRAAAQVGMEFVLSILVGAFLGYKLDQWLETTPLFLILLFFLGVFAGFMSIYRASKNLGSAVGYSQLHREKKDATKAPTLVSNDQDKEEE